MACSLPSPCSSDVHVRPPPQPVRTGDDRGDWQGSTTVARAHLKPVYRVVVRETLECHPVLDVENVLSLTLVDQNLVYMSKTNTFRSFSIFSAEFVSHHICLKNEIKNFYTITNENREHPTTHA